MTKKRSPGKIITFYSYKGGTGRSMMMANVAWILASSGKKVLVIDWDLEAPGLHRYFYPFLADKDSSFSDGVINFVTNYKLKVMRPPAKGVTVPDDW
ncbi:MAG TPA: AAA family ATPase, partial [Pyrinomonadaceae bacterium]|nr:AAA family ATPase [Pyrinomonadaceae bacterium]